MSSWAKSLVLHPGRIACGAFCAAIPVYARFCPQCGQETEYGQETGALK